MLQILLLVLPLILAVYAVVDLLQTDPADVQGMPKPAWAVLIVLGWLVGPLAWFLAGSRTGRFRGLLPKVTGPHPPRRAPDDDPEFLARLRRQQPPHGTAPPDSTAPPHGTAPSPPPPTPEIQDDGDSNPPLEPA